MLAAAVLVAGLASAGCLDPGASDRASLAEVVDPRATLHITVHTMPGMALEPQAFEDWLAVVREVRGGNVVVERGHALATDDATTIDEAFELGETWNDEGPRSDADTVHLPLLLLQSSDPPGIAGVTGSLTTGNGRQVFTAIFVKSLRDAAYFPLEEPLPLPSPAPSSDLLVQVERAVLVHEFGHALGLVGCGIPEVRSHQAQEYECHSANKESVMWFIMHNSDDIRKYILEDGFSPVWRFDADDLADIRAAQETLANGGRNPLWPPLD